MTSIVPDRVTNTPTALIRSICSMAFLEKVLSVSMSVTEIASSWPMVREMEETESNVSVTKPTKKDSRILVQLSLFLSVS